jgi:hypothetical protein
MLMKTIYGEAIQRILSRFGATDSAVAALEIVIQTAEAKVKQLSTAELAAKTCRGLHMDKPGSGVVCAKCFDAAFEKGARDKALTGDELARGKVGAPAGIVPPDPREAEKMDRDAIAEEVRRMLGDKA